MTKKTRSVLFTLCLVFFLLAAPALVLYSQGYRFDFDEKRISQTGGLFIKAVPKQAEIYLSDGFEKKTDFLFGSALIENVLPRKYKVEVRKEGYVSWYKTLEVKEKEVTEAKNIILFKENPELETLASRVDDFWLFPDQKKLILKEVNGENWALKLYDTEKKLKSHLLEDKDIYLQDPDLLSLEFSQNPAEVYLEIGAQETIEYFILNLGKNPPTLTRTESPAPKLDNALTYLKVDGDTYYLSTFGHLFKNQDKLTWDPFLVKQETGYLLKWLAGRIFLQENNTLYVFNQDHTLFEEVFEPLNDFKLSPDSKKILAFSDYEIWILYLGDELPMHKAADKVLLMRLSEKISNCFWLNSHYIVFTSGNKVRISETDERDRVNTVEITETKNPDIFWSENNKKLYILSEGNLSYLGLLF